MASALSPVRRVSESVHSSFISRSCVHPLSVNFDLYGDGVVHPHPFITKHGDTYVNPVKRRLVLAGILSLSLIAAACGSDDDASDSTAAPAASDSATTTEAPAPADTAADATTTEAPAPADTTPADSGDVDFAALSGSLVGSGATFPKGFYDDAIATLAGIAPDLTVEYGGGGSGKGRSDLQEMVVDFAGTDGVVKAEDMAKLQGWRVRLRPHRDRSDHAVVQPARRRKAATLARPRIAAIFQLEITKWNDPLIAADNPGVTLPDTDIVVARRADGSGTTENFSKFLNAAAGPMPVARGSWAGRPSSSGRRARRLVTATAASPRSSQRNEGAIGYVDLSDAKANNLTFALGA